MKQILLVFSIYFFIVLIISCNNEKSESSNNNEVDTTIIASLLKDKKQALLKDSFNKTEQDKAIGDIHFSINNSKYNSAKAIFLKKCKPDNEDYFKKYELGGYFFNDIIPLFIHDSLYSLELNGYDINYERYDFELLKQYTALKALLTTKYGESTKNNGFPRWSDIEKHYYRICTVWEIGKKTIEIRIYCEGVDYHINLASYQPDIVNIVEELKNKKDKNKTEKGKAVI